MRYTSHSGRSRSFEAGYEGVINNLQRRYRETESEWVKQEIERLMMQKPCPACNGRAAQAGVPRGDHRRHEHRRVLQAQHQSRRCGASIPLRAQRARADDRAAR